MAPLARYQQTDLWTKNKEQYLSLLHRQTEVLQFLVSGAQSRQNET